MLSVALIIETLDGGGAERVIRRLAPALAQRGHRIFVYCLRTPEIDVTPLQAAGVIVRAAHSTGRDWTLPWRLLRWLRADRIQLVHAHSCAALAVAFPAAKLLQLPILHVWHGWTLGRPTRYHELAKRLDLFVTRVGVNSRAVQSRLPAWPQCQRALHLPNGLDLEPHDAYESRRLLHEVCGQQLAGPVILSIGNIRPEKDVCTLLEAFARVRPQHPTVQLICVGDTRDRTEYLRIQQVRAALDLQHCTHFIGPVRDAWRLLPAADVFCLSSCRESMPNVILEAMSQRVPIVATTVGDVGSLNADQDDPHWLLHHNRTALLTPPQNPAHLAQALAATLTDNTAARQRATRAHEDYRHRFTTASMTTRYEQAYMSCLRLRRAQQHPRIRHSKPTVIMLGPAPPAIGGMVTSITRLLDSPLRDGYELSRVATPKLRDTAPPGPRLLQPILRTLDAARRHTAALITLAANILRRRADLVHIHTCSYFTYYRNLIDVALAKALGCRVILHIRGGQFETFCHHATPRQQRLIRRGLSAADAIIVLAPSPRNALRSFAGPTPIHVVPNGVDIGPAVTRHDHDGPCRFLYLAALTHAKGLDDLLEAAALLHYDGVEFTLTIAGPTTAEPQSFWHERTRELRITDIVRLVGPVTGDAKTTLWSWADCFVHPSHSEAFPNAILEAAAARLPIVATAVGHVPAMLTTPDGQPLTPLVEPRYPAALAAAMLDFATDLDLRLTTGQRLRNHVRTHYSMPRVAAELDKIYRQTLGAPTSPPLKTAQPQPQVHQPTPPRNKTRLPKLCTVEATPS